MGNSQYDVVVVYGGRSTEHEISCRSAAFVAKTVQSLGHRLHLMAISKNGGWYLQDPHKVLLGESKELSIAEETPLTDLFCRDQRHPVSQVFLRTFREKRKLERPAVVFPVVHGFGGEDGTLQGILDFAEIPYVGPDLLGSAIGMDKVIAKKLVETAGVKVVPSVVLHKHEATVGFGEKSEIQNFIKEYGFPIFVKPARQGSSVGVSKVLTLTELVDGCEKAFQFDDKVLLERAILGREIEVGVIGDSALEVAIPGEIVVHADFYSFDAKYVQKTQAKPQVPANLSADQVALVKELAKKCYKAMTLSGMSRVDFFFDNNQQEFIFNEVNTIPGFTEISLFPLMWEKSGLKSEKLIEKLLDLALERYTTKSKLKRARN